MKLLWAFKLIGFAVGVALQLSLFILIRRYLRIKKLEALFLSLLACLLVWNVCNFFSLLFQTTTTQLNRFLLSLIPEVMAVMALAAIPSLLLHAHLAYLQAHLGWPQTRLTRICEVALYLPLLALPDALLSFLDRNYEESVLAAGAYARPFAAWFALSLLASASLQGWIRRQSRKAGEKQVFTVLILVFVGVALLLAHVYFGGDLAERLHRDGFYETVLMLWSIIPCSLLGYSIFRYNFLEIAIEKSLGYSLTGILLLLVYLSSVRGLGTFIESTYGFPGFVVEVAMILALFGLSHPIKRWLDRSVKNIFSVEVSKYETLATRLEQTSRTTVEVQQLLDFMDDLLQKELGLSSARVVLYDAGAQPAVAPAPRPQTEDQPIPLFKGEVPLGEIRIQTPTGSLTPEQQAALRFLSTQIVAAVENCRLAEDKIRLERELAERDKMAALGQMAATVAHNIKNPLSSIKTIVQVMKEDGTAGLTYGKDLSLINSEIDRLSDSVGQLLRFSKPTPRSSQPVLLNGVLERVCLVFKSEAERKGAQVVLRRGPRQVMVPGPEEVLTEIFQNLVVNAVEVAPAQTSVTVDYALVQSSGGSRVQISVADEGPGIPPDIRKQIFKPFFTTKQKGTGLGLAVVHRRLLDLGGLIECVSPASDRGGTRFEVTLPMIGLASDEFPARQAPQVSTTVRGEGE
ncbi:MAG: ATP-binding protein [Acidobacteriota bacterium]